MRGILPNYSAFMKRNQSEWTSPPYGSLKSPLQAVIAAGGGAVGNIATTEVSGVGSLRVVYARDPEGNIVELQKWT